MPTGASGSVGERLAQLRMLPRETVALPLNAQGLDFLISVGEMRLGVQVRSCDAVAGRGLADQSGECATKMVAAANARDCTHLIILGLAVDVGRLSIGSNGDLVLDPEPALVRAGTVPPSRWLELDRAVRAANGGTTIRYPVKIDDLHALPIRRATWNQLLDRGEQTAVTEAAVRDMSSVAQ